MPGPPKLLKTAKGSPRDLYGNSFVAVARCACGHDALLPDAFVRCAALYGLELERERAKLRCSKCGARMPRVEVYRAQRPG